MLPLQRDYKLLEGNDFASISLVIIVFPHVLCSNPPTVCIQNGFTKCQMEYGTNGGNKRQKVTM